MEKMLITADKIKNNQVVPQAMLPKRYAVATNLICALRSRKFGGSGILVLNYEPEKWNQWFPFYSTINGFGDFSSKRFGDLHLEFAGILESLVGTPQDRLEKAMREFKDLYNCGEISIVKKPIVEPEVWLKFSKTQDIWTYYFVEFYSISKVARPSSLQEQSRIAQAMVPIDRERLSMFLRDGQIDGVPLVDNTISLLSNTDALARIRKNIIGLDE